MVKNLPAMQETWVRSLGQEDPLEKRMATHSNILALRIPWTEEPCRLHTMGFAKNPPAMQNTQVLPLGQEDPLEKRMATHSSILAWRIPWTRGA